MYQRTLVLIKPDAFKRGLVHEVLGRIEKKGYQIENLKFYNPAPMQLIYKHYEQSSAKPFYIKNCNFIASGPLMAIVYVGEDVINCVRNLQGNKDFPGTIRGDLVTDVRENLLHSSDSAENAAREITIWFPEEVGLY